MIMTFRVCQQGFAYGQGVSDVGLFIATFCHISRKEARCNARLLQLLEDNTLRMQEFDSLLEQLCGFPNMRVLVTSRCAIACSCAAHVLLGSLDSACAVSLLQQLCRRCPGWDATQAAKLAELCGCNALCLTIIGSFISAGRCTWKVGQMRCLCDKLIVFLFIKRRISRQVP
jgi:hypothetical protein